MSNNTGAAHRDNAEHLRSETEPRPAVFCQLQFRESTKRAEATCKAFVFGQKVCERAGPTKLSEVTSDTTRENSGAPSGSECFSQEAPRERVLDESAAAYTKAT